MKCEDDLILSKHFSSNLWIPGIKGQEQPIISGFLWKTAQRAQPKLQNVNSQSSELVSKETIISVTFFG